MDKFVFIDEERMYSPNFCKEKNGVNRYSHAKNIYIRDLYPLGREDTTDYGVIIDGISIQY